ncbi:hypothetical protein PFICI_11431 [Pestalotiopsis fici W106-1]|uniref:Trichothecene 3-O-acetyltransferase-like N-terminal domain-containing protein n=1 Tax=Pestalotiopsis fici (strain W106-1 / CGMCC3.15140) TaxID=1229662 RepID=W3WWP6_PESFW|nr:uncharacterized protein PFICI_11431 [Pestalotiopsis fici W106-1]ETS77557.1 hypothetical protein PFICI_11431 [Pestalotiopsis fici W106-1]
MASDPESSSELLSINNQASPRVYTSLLLCFGLESDFRDYVGLKKHLQSSLDKLAETYPLLTAHLFADANNGVASLTTTKGAKIPFRVVQDATNSSAQSYDEMKEAGFPQSLFTHERFGRDGRLNAEGKPVMYIEGIIIRGGMFLHCEFHHAVFDGRLKSEFLGAFAAITRGDVHDTFLPSNQSFHHTAATAIAPSYAHFDALLEECPEFGMLVDKSGPTFHCYDNEFPYRNLEKTGKIFTINRARMGTLQYMIQGQLAKKGLIAKDKNPSTYSCLAALAFMCIVRARSIAEPFNNRGNGQDDTAIMHHAVNWHSRALKKHTKNYFGVSTLPAFTAISMAFLKESSGDLNALALIADLVKRDTAQVDDDYVHKRLNLSSPDPRLIGVNYDPRSPNVIAFNTWRHFGGSDDWEIPGTISTRPDAVRRTLAGWGTHNCLILPQTGDDQEILVQLPEVTMEVLCKDRNWYDWFEVIE